MAKKAEAGEKKGKGKGKVAMPRWSPLERQYLGINLGVLGSVVVLGGMTQNYFNKDLAMLLGFAVVLIALFFHETRPIQRRGWGDITDEFKGSLKATEKEDAKKKD